MPNVSVSPTDLSVLGLIIVFAVLALIAIVVRVMRLVDDRWQAGEAEDHVHATERTPTIDETTLVIITATVATLFQGRGRIRRIWRHDPSETPHGAWSLQGRATLQGSHAIQRSERGTKR